MPDGLRYVDSWIEANFDRCFQLMECDDPLLLQKWILQWRDLMEFEIVPVSASKAIRELFSSAGGVGMEPPAAASKPDKGKE